MPGKFVDIERSIELSQDPENLGAHPGSLAKIKPVTNLRGQNHKKILQAPGVYSPLGWKLEQHWAKFLVQMNRARQQIV